MPSDSLAPDLDSVIRSLSGIAPSWRGRAEPSQPVQATGFAQLDALLPGGGWPVGCLTELLPSTHGIGELSLTLPALRALCQTQRRVILIDPPFMPDPPALQSQGVPLKQTLWLSTQGSEDGVWAAVQLLRTSSTGAVLLWSSPKVERELRKLQLAAESGGSLAFLFRDITASETASPAALRLELRPVPQALEARLRKVRGGRPGVVRIPRSRLPVLGSAVAGVPA